MYAIEPLGVVFPRDGDEAAAVVSTAAQFGVPVLARGAGTSLAGQAVGRAVVMDFSRHMDRILAIDAEARRARVQPGVVQEQLNLAAARHGLMFGPDTSTSNRATLGGMIGNNSAGSHSVRYGMTVDHVLSLDVVLSDASRAAFGPLSAAEVASRAARPGAGGHDLPGTAAAGGAERRGHRHRLPAVLAPVGRVPAGPPGRAAAGRAAWTSPGSWSARRARWSRWSRRTSPWCPPPGTG